MCSIALSLCEANAWWIGTGSGVAGIAAALAGAREVIAVDLDPRALTFCKLNAELNGVHLQCMNETPCDWDLLLASDVLYEVSVRDDLLSLRGSSVRSDRRMLIADPRRPGNPRLELAPLAVYSVQCLPDVDYPVREAAIYEL